MAVARKRPRMTVGGFDRTATSGGFACGARGELRDGPGSRGMSMAVGVPVERASSR